MPLSPATAYAFVVFGLLLVYAELTRPGAVLPGTCGLVLLCLGSHGLWRCGLRAGGLALCAAAVALFSAEAIGRSRLWLGGLPATAALIAGSLTLCRTPVPPLLAITGSVAMGASTTLLLRASRRARRNKSVTAEHAAGTERHSAAYS